MEPDIYGTCNCTKGNEGLMFCGIEKGNEEWASMLEKVPSLLSLY